MVSVLLVRPELLKFCSLFLVSVFVFTLVYNFSNEDATDLASITGAQAAEEEPLPGEEGAHPGFASCRSLPEDTQMQLIYNCEDAGYEHCDVVIGHVFKFTASEMQLGDPCALQLPPEEAGYEGNSLKREWISCADPKTITIARYNHETKDWEPIGGAVAEEEGEGENIGLQVTSTVATLGDYAVIKKTADYLLPNEDPTRDPTCYEFACFGTDEVSEEEYATKTFKASYTIPELQLRAGGEIDLFACGMIKGCVALADGIQNRACPPGIDPDIGLATCTNKLGDCCIPANDGECDRDCWIKPVILEDGTTLTNEDGEVIAEESTDPDCTILGSVDKLSNLGIETWSNSYTLPPHQGRAEPGAWTDYEITAEEINGFNSVILEGEVSFKVDTSTYVWFKDFTYTDLNGIQHKLYPIRQIGVDWALAKGSAEDGERDFGNKDENDNWPVSGAGPEYLQTSYESIKKYDDDCCGDNDQSTDKSYWNYLFFHPYVWYQNVKGGTAVQFKFPKIAVKSISFAATSDRSNQEPTFTMNLEHYNINADEDHDNYGAEIDCHDKNPSINPGAREICNNLDDNCNGYGRVDTSEAELQDQPLRWSSGDFNDDWNAEGWNIKSHISDCDGYIQISRVNDGPVYAELWKIDERLPQEYLDTGFNSKEKSDYISDEFWELSSEKRPYGYLWTSYQRILAAGDDFSVDTDEEGPAAACHPGRLHSNEGRCDNDGDQKACVVGTRDSCNLKLDAKDCGGSNYASTDDERYNVWDRVGNQLLAKSADEEAFNIPEGQGKIEISKGEIIIASVQHGQCGTDEKGSVTIDRYCYTELPPLTNRTAVDEGLDGCIEREEEEKTIHFCKSDAFDYLNRRCFEGNDLCPPRTTQTDGGSCTFETMEGQEPGSIDYYVFTCPKDIEEECYKYTEDRFKICSEKEVCNPGINEDQDCDGLKPYATRDDGSVDTSKWLDSDCEKACVADSCDLTNKKWCNLGEWDESNYCQKCGSKDSSCGKACAEGERSCQGGCFPNSCDVSDNKWCNDGYWDNEGYAEKCGKGDSEYYVQAGNDCTHRGCDVNAHKICFPSVNIWSWGLGEIGRAYCDTDCKNVDSSCNKACTPTTCDVEAEKYCNNEGSWIASDNYCDLCGALDADCGVDICAEGTCDYGSHKVCINKKWSQPTDYCARCAAQEIATGFCACTPTVGQEEKETSCIDRKDNDCDGVADCSDPDCPSDLPECTCIEGDVQTCGVNVGLCMAGTQTCSSGSWRECIGEVKPLTETCNSYDDDCDGNTDEGCGSCLAGETRQCGIDRGLCSGGLQACDARTGLWSTCSGPVYRTTTTEQCDGKDNNCNGQIDESCACVEDSNQSCGDNIGICKAGTQTCSGGRWEDCVGLKDKLPEVCNDGLDNDCDGLTDSADDSCKASSSLAQTCYDAIQNQGEDNVDCGGPCEDCNKVSCNDRQKNGDEEGLDCGGSKCPPCGEVLIKVSECGNDDCEDTEDSDSCPEDCPTIAPAKPKKKSSPFGAIVVIVLLLGIGGIVLMAFLKSKKTGQPLLEVLKGMLPKKKFLPAQKVTPTQKPSQKPQVATQKPAFLQPSQPARPTKRKSFEEEQLEESFKRSAEIFKK